MQDITTFIALHPGLSLATLVVFVLILIVELIRARRKSTSLTPAQVTQMINHQHAVVIDTRPTDIYRKGHIIDAVSMMPEEIKNNAKKLEKFKSRPIILVCGSGVESQKLATILQKLGYNVTSLNGGIRSWTEAQMPLIKE